MIKYKNIITCMSCFGTGKIFRRYEANNDSYSVKEINESCKECKGYGYILEIHEFPDDIVINRVNHKKVSKHELH